MPISKYGPYIDIGNINIGFCLAAISILLAAIYCPSDINIDFSTDLYLWEQQNFKNLGLIQTGRYEKSWIRTGPKKQIDIKLFEGCSDPSHFIFEIIVGKSRI